MNVVDVGVAVVDGGEFGTALGAGVGGHGGGVANQRKKEASWTVKGEDGST